MNVKKLKSPSINRHTKFLLSISIPMNDIFSKEHCATLASEGKLYVLKVLRNGGAEWDAQTCVMAAKNNHLELLQWARSDNCPWNADVCETAVTNGHLEIFQWAYVNGCAVTEETKKKAKEQWPNVFGNDK